MILARTDIKRSSKPLRSTKQMDRGTSTLSRATGIGRGTAQLARTGTIRVNAMTAGPETGKPKKRKRAMKTTRPKMTAIRLSAKDEECTLRFPCCNYRVDTTVLCHRNGAGGGMKAPDTDAAYGCFACHVVLDGHATRPDGFTRDMMLARFDGAVRLTHIRLAVKGLIRLLDGGAVEVAGAAEKAAHKNKSRRLLEQVTASTRIN